MNLQKLYLTNVVTGKRYIKKLVEDGIVDGWDDPRLVTITALRRRGYTASSIRKFMELCGVSKVKQFRGFCNVRVLHPRGFENVSATNDGSVRPG